MNVWIGLSQINQLANEIGLLAHVILKLKMAETLLSEIMNSKSPPSSVFNDPVEFSIRAQRFTEKTLQTLMKILNGT